MQVGTWEGWLSHLRADCQLAARAKSKSPLLLGNSGDDVEGQDDCVWLLEDFHHCQQESPLPRKELRTQMSSESYLGQQRAASPRPKLADILHTLSIYSLNVHLP